ncbi:MULTISPECIES: hypothetical protein [Candidatus Ichthyocystis]|uniref:Uncharacterized protein n=1 Tax=Candidatus Ichthyocystis hellenicum TaxID=1561003 RepID=A0A0S4M1Y1_9BURK|nr:MULTISPECIES: hypothetical protein [Ichthyocystis]CUT17779.1 hypothetical protein Ark11_0959 [Candidatus Ichthyocystis hellenicum]
MIPTAIVANRTVELYHRKCSKGNKSKSFVLTFMRLTEKSHSSTGQSLSYKEPQY